MKRIVGAASIAALALVASPAVASPSAKLVYIRGSGAETCPPESDLRKAVAVRLGYDPFFPTAQKTVVTQVSRSKDGFRGKVQIVGDDGALRGERDLATTGDDCNELMSALALTVSIALDDLDEVLPRDLPPPAPPAPPAPPVPPSPRPAAKPAPHPSPSGPEFALSGGPALAVGTAPAPAVGVSVAVSARWKLFALRADVRGELPASASLEPSGRVSTNVLFATASGCLRGRLPFACLGMGGGVVSSRTEGITAPASDAAALLVVVGRAGLDLPLGSLLYVEGLLEGGLQAFQHRVAVDGRKVYEMPLGWGAMAGHLGARFP